MSQRPLGLEEGPRLKVAAFRLAGARDLPDDGIKLAEIEALLANSVATQPEAGFTVNQMHEVAGKVAEYYHKAGFVLAQAFVPAQDVTNSTVTIQVLEGRLNAVRVEGNKQYSTDRLIRPFNGLIGGPVAKGQVESALLRLTDYPGLSAFGVFSAGQDVGTTDLLIRVQKEDRLGFDASVDNHGTQFTGEYRGQVGMTVNNVTGHADRAHVYVLSAFDPSDNAAQGLYGGIEYYVPLFSPANSLQLAYSTNAFEVGQDLRELNFEGDTSIASLDFRRAFSRSRFGSASMGLGLARKVASFEQDGFKLNEDVLAVASLDFTVDHIDTRFRGVNRLSLAAFQGIKDFMGSLDDFAVQELPRSSRLNASGEFTKFVLSLQRLQRITQNSAVLLRVTSQHSSDLLVSLEQLSLGGPDTVRAYPTAEVLADKGTVASLELIFNAPGFAARPAFGDRTWGQILQVSLFADYASGRINQPLPTEREEVELSGAGIGLQFNLPGRVFARADVATPLSNDEPSNDRDPQYYLRFGFTF